MRLFIAIDIDETIRRSLRDLQDKLAESIEIKKGDAKWVDPELMHLTLKFLGEIKDENVAEICDIVKNVAESNKKFDLDVGQVGYFGRKSARILCVGTGGSDDLLKLQGELEEKLDRAGWPKENREFSGHLTLCRIKNFQAGIKLAAASEDYKDFKAGSLAVDSIRVYQSQLTPSEPVYTLLGNYQLQ